jgi:hypothetical protein
MIKGDYEVEGTTNSCHETVPTSIGPNGLECFFGSRTETFACQGDLSI